MTPSARKCAYPAARPSPLAVFIARAEARALLWQAGEFDLHNAVDALQAAARDGVIATLGQDAVQEIISKAFGVVR
jgi:hypothetical protein